MGALAAFIKIAGRGAAGSRALSRGQSQEAFATMLDGRASMAEVGAFTMAMRMKGESADELAGFLDATHTRCRLLAADSPVVVLPSCNGARRLPNLTPLLARLLAREGVKVLLHSPRPHAGEESRRLTTPALLPALGLEMAESESAVQCHWARGEPAFVSTAWLCPPLQTLLDLRWLIGVRGPAHTVAKMLAPVAGAPALRVVNHTHPEFGNLMRQWVRDDAANALLLRGLEGEPVSDPRRQAELMLHLGGAAIPELSVAADAVPASAALDLPLLAGRPDPQSSARWTHEVLSGQRPLPTPLARQVQTLTAAVGRLQARASTPAPDRSHEALA
jgi:anthranilate phosphoribosyltransferase